MPPAEEDGGENGRTHHDVSILGDKEDPELEASVLGMKTAHQIGFGFGHVKRQAIGLGKKGYEKDQG